MLILPWENIIETKKCLLSGTEFVVTDKDLEFYDTISPIFHGKKYRIPSPTLCFDERRRRRLCFYNQRFLYKNVCAITGKNIISRIAPDRGLTTYSIEAWSDRSWDPKKFGIPMNFDIPFFEQIHHLIKTTPYQNLVGSSHNATNNALYTNHTSELKNCYLISNANQVTDAYYCSDIKKSEQCIDCLSCSKAKDCYECVACHDVAACLWCEYVTNSTYCFKSRLLKGCYNCLACINLNHKKNHVLNRPVSPEEFKTIEWKYMTDSSFKREIDERYSQLYLASFFPTTNNVNAENSIGDTLYNVSDCLGFNINSSTHCRYCESIIDSHHLMDVSDFWEIAEYMYEWVSVGRQSQHILFSGVVGKGTNFLYCLEVKKSHDCFGCVNMHYVDHCILNTPYSVQEYETLCGKIIDHMRSTGEWWEFFPHELSPFWYNETLANEYFPLTEKEVEEKWWNWYSGATTTLDGTGYQPLPIREYDEKQVGYEKAQNNIDILLAETIKCAISGRPFKIVPQELVFYIENSVDIPSIHPDERHKARMDLRNARAFHERECTQCHTSIVTTYAPSRPEKIVCETCYKHILY